MHWRPCVTKGAKFVPGAVDEWLDCGNKDATVYTNQRVLELKKGSEQLIAGNLVSRNSVVIEPCYIGPDVVPDNAVVGPHVSLGVKERLLKMLWYPIPSYRNPFTFTTGSSLTVAWWAATWYWKVIRMILV